ncbi:unnamed protein product [Rotaria socialis]|uniref:F-box domain-containing protein n=1 Tax=Rotaria socialis TaxID=392032 RepID=A0A817TMY9_9BILA|nr:unnamed protein product [Rotaria socialis]CAF3321418.1 unnamed protein product [Rotaria socialis]CAF3446305.1 unnamed protein product [Rotaria socialis]CAF4206598.1 unnamed protein product [Rotaria socialis]CAF4386048.1 unnamed protein product [Rotaria socialis]
MCIDNIPHHVIYKLCKYLSFMNIMNLSRRCKQLYILIENDNYFWMILIQNHFGSKLYQRYVNEIFQNEKNSDYALYRTEEDKKRFEKSFRGYSDLNLCNMWLLNVLNSKDNSDGYTAHRSIIKQKTRPRTSELKMSLTMEELFEYYLNENKYLTKENILHIPNYKLIYFYLIQPKRLLGVDLFAIDLRCTRYHRACCNVKYPMQEYDLNSSIGRCLRLHSIRGTYLCGIKGKFKSILPGTYEITCRIRLDKNNEYLTYYNEYCSKYHPAEKSVLCHFYALADHGLDCVCDENKMNYDWFESNCLLHDNTHWFTETMGTIKVFEVSDIYSGFRTRADHGIAMFYLTIYN